MMRKGCLGPGSLGGIYGTGHHRRVGLGFWAADPCDDLWMDANHCIF